MHLLSNEKNRMRQPCSGLRGKRRTLADQALSKKGRAFRPAIAQIPCTVVRGIPALQADILCDRGSKRQKMRNHLISRGFHPTLSQILHAFLQ